MHFAYMTWFRQCYDHKAITPWPTYHALKRALQPVLVSAELWGRNLYAGERLPVRIYTVNDDEQGRDLPATTLEWRITDDNDRTLSGYVFRIYFACGFFAVKYQQFAPGRLVSA